MAEITQTLKYVLLGEDRSASKTLKQVGAEAGKAGQQVKTSGSVMKGSLGADIVADGARAILDFGSDSIKQFAAVEDATGAASVIYGKSMGVITAQSETAAQKMGMTKLQALEAANTFGTFGKAAGLSGGDLAGFSTKMTGLAGDLASFKGTSPEQAVQAIGAALRGETEPIRAYGVMLDDASMRQEALKLGLIKTTKDALTPQQKSLAAQSLILKQTKDAQGDYERTASSTSNTLKTQQAKFADLQATLGEKLAPALVLITQLGMQVVDWISQNSTWLGPLAAGLAAGAVAYGILTAAVGLHASFTAAAAAAEGGLTVAQWALNAALSANPIALVVIAIAALVAGLIWAYNNVSWFRDGVNTAFKAIAEIGRWLWNNALAPALRGIVNGFAWVVDGLAGMLEGLGSIPGFEWAKTAAQNLRGMAAGARAAAQGIKDIPPATNPRVSLKDQATAKIREIDSKIKSLKGKIVEAKARGDSKEVTALQKKINALKNKKVDIQANVRKTGINSIKIYASGGGTMKISAAAGGGIFRRYAAGGIEGASRIYQTADGVQFNEPDTRGEAYVPLADDWRRPGAVRVWRETGRILGQYAAGGIIPGRSGASLAAGGGVMQVVNLTAHVARGVDPYGFAREVEAELVRLKQRNRRLGFE